jgi:hypothetical protein
LFYSDPEFPGHFDPRVRVPPVDEGEEEEEDEEEGIAPRPKRARSGQAAPGAGAGSGGVSRTVSSPAALTSAPARKRPLSPDRSGAGSKKGAVPGTGAEAGTGPVARPTLFDEIETFLRSGSKDVVSINAFITRLDEVKAGTGADGYLLREMSRGDREERITELRARLESLLPEEVEMAGAANVSGSMEDEEERGGRRRRTYRKIRRTRKRSTYKRRHI